MAMSVRSREGAGAGNRGRTGVRPVYEEFKPVFEWKYGEGVNILLYHLPGFVKEQIRILAESKGILRVRGECFVGGNKWKRFQEEVMVPEDCNMSEIRAKFKQVMVPEDCNMSKIRAQFEDGILTILMPKKIKPTQDNIITNAPNPIRNPVKPEYDHTSTSNAQDTIRNPAKPVLDQTNINAPNPIINPTRPEYDHTTTNAPDTIKNPTIPVYDQNTNAPNPIRYPTEPVYDHNTNAPNPIRKPTNPVYVRNTNAPNPIRNPTKPEFDHTSANAPDPIKTDKVKPSAMHDYEHPKASMPKPQTRLPQQAQEESVLKQAQMMEEDRKYKKASDYDNNNENHVREKNHEVYEEDYKRAYNKVTRKLEEDRQLLVNMGVAVLVIMGLGAYMSYSFGSPT